MSFTLRRLRGIRGVLSALAVVSLVVLMAAPAAAAALSDHPRKTAWADARVSSLAYSSTTLYLGGDFTSLTNPDGTTVPRNHLAAVDTTTGFVTSWNPGADKAVQALAVSGPSVYVGGDFSFVGGQRHTRLARLDAVTGAPDPSFNPTVDARVSALAVSTDRIFVGGKFLNVDAQPRSHLAAVSPVDGSLITAWAPAASDEVRAIVPAGARVYVTGAFPALNGVTKSGYLAAVNASDGQIDPTFPARLSYRGFDLAVTETAVYVAADGPGGHLRSYNLAGNLLWDRTTDGGVQAVTYLDGVIYFGGHWDNICVTARTGGGGACVDGGIKQRKLAAVTPDGVLTSWAPRANSALGVFALESGVNQIAAGGDFTTFKSGTISQPHLAVFG